MCIVTYLPLSDDSFILVSSREEIPSRVSEAPRIYKDSSTELLYPRDVTSGGTWIITSNNGKAACLLNGAFTRYSKKDFYKHSRGLIPIKYLRHKSFLNFYFQYDLQEIEPFTLIAYEDKALFQLKWDGEKAHVKNLIHKLPYIWSSAALYSPETIEEREKRFKEWSQKNPFDVENLIAFHKEEERSFFGEKIREVQTLSITAIKHSDGLTSMIYEDYKTGVRSQEDLKS